MTDPVARDRPATPIYCTGACDACREYAAELGVPLIVQPPVAAGVSANPVEVSGGLAGDWTALANDIRIVDGNHDLGAGALAAALTERGWSRPPAAPGLDVERLALAFHATACSKHGHPVEYDRPYIELIAREYAALDDLPEGLAVEPDE